MKHTIKHTITFYALLVFGLLQNTNIMGQKAHEINRNRRYDEVSWLITHNANNNRTDGPRGFFGCFGGGNQGNGIQKQLQDGVRSFMTDIYLVDGVIKLKHGSPNMCMMDGRNFNNILYNWLANHPLDVITLHIESGSNLRKNELDDLFYGRKSGYKNMSRYIYNHSTFVSRRRPRGAGSDVYPTVQEMLDQKKQLVIFTETNYNSDLYRYEFGHTAQNPFRAAQTNELFDVNKFRVDRGIDHKTVLTVNHFAGDPPTYNGDVNKSKGANNTVHSKLITAWYMFGHRPSIAVDYYHLSNGRSPLYQVREVNRINEVRGQFMDANDPKKHVRDVKTYLAEFKNGKWQKIKNIDHRGKRASWHLFYSFPARANDNRALFFEHPNYSFSPAFVETGNYGGNDSRTHVVNVIATPKTGKRSVAERDDTLVLEEANPGFQDNFMVFANSSRPGTLMLFYNFKTETAINLRLYDLSGRLIDDTFDEKLFEGKSQFQWESEHPLLGIYILKGTIAGKSYTKKVVFKN